MNLARIVTTIALASVVGGCAHNGNLSTPSSNAIILGRTGVPEFADPNKCPMPNGEGAMKKTWDNGETMFKGKSKAGLMVGPWAAFYEYGAKDWEATFDGSGKITGEFKSYYANDAKRAKVPFKDGAAEGKYEAWHLNGEVQAKGQYVGGKKNGCWETWFDNKQQESKGTYSDDAKVLTWLYWTATGDRRKDKVGGEAAHGQCLITL